jgi:site-specific DNA-methyltransferase (adenine-specific)
MLTCTAEPITSQLTDLATKHRVYFKNSQNMKEVEDGEVQLVITSPPYWNIKDYGNEQQIGYRDSLPQYFRKLNKVWAECIRTLSDGCRLCINIGDQYLRASETTPYQIIPLHAMLVNSLMDSHSKEMLYLGSIIWKKIPTTKTSGGASVMGSYGYPRNGYVSYNYEYIAIFKKKGNAPKPNSELKKKSKIELFEWRELFNGIWNFKGARQVGHVAIFPDELPRRLMRMFTYEGDTVLDPFLGSGTTSRVAWELGRNSVGYEIGFAAESPCEWKELVKEKIHFYDTVSSERNRVFPTLT